MAGRGRPPVFGSKASRIYATLSGSNRAVLESIAAKDDKNPSVALSNALNAVLEALNHKAPVRALSEEKARAEGIDQALTRELRRRAAREKRLQTQIDAQERKVRRFAAVLQHMLRGQLHRESSEKIAAFLREVHAAADEFVALRRRLDKAVELEDGAPPDAVHVGLTPATQGRPFGGGA